MNDPLESRLRRAAKSLDAAAESWQPSSSGVEPAEKSRRWLVTTGAAATLIAGVVAVAVISRDDETSSPLATQPAETAAPTDPSVPSTEATSASPAEPPEPPPNQLTRALRTLGVDLDEAPRGATRLDAEFCGVDRFDGERFRPEDAAQRCVVERYEAGKPAIAVVEQFTIEGDPLITVYHADPDGHVDVYTDFTRDAFGSGEWSVDRCDRVALDRDGIRPRGCG